MIFQALDSLLRYSCQRSGERHCPTRIQYSGVSFAFEYLPARRIAGCLSALSTVQRGKKMVEKPRRMIVPEQVKNTSGISCKFLWDNSTYVLGFG